METTLYNIKKEIDENRKIEEKEGHSTNGWNWSGLTYRPIAFSLEAIFFLSFLTIIIK